MANRRWGEQPRVKDWVARRWLGMPPIVLAHDGLWGCQPWKTAATGTGLACTPFAPFAPLAGPPSSPVCLLSSPPCSGCSMASLFSPLTPVAPLAFGGCPHGR